MDQDSVNEKSNYTKDTNPDILIRRIDELENLLFQKDVEILERDEEISCLKHEIKTRAELVLLLHKERPVFFLRKGTGR